MSSIPEGEIVSITAVLETMELKRDFTGCPFSSLPSQSPARACSLWKAAAEWEAAKSGTAHRAAPTKNRLMRRILMNFSSRIGNSSPRHTCAVGRRAREERKQAGYRFREAEATSMMGLGMDCMVRTKAATIVASNCAFAQ